MYGDLALFATIEYVAAFSIEDAAIAMRMERGSPLHEELRQLLLERRQKAKLTQRELATKLGWDQSTVSKIENGSKRVSVVELIELGRALDFDAPAAVRRVMRKG